MKLRPFLNIVATGFGSIMVLSPLALWVVCSEKMLYGILPTFGLLFCVLSLIDNGVAARDSIGRSDHISI